MQITGFANKQKNYQWQHLQDSSTSNEIFSHRRGLQQQQQQQQQQLIYNRQRNLSFDSLLTAAQLADANRHAGEYDDQLANNSSHSRAIGLSAQQLLIKQQQQMEANRRKYVKQHQATTAFKSPTLSLQKANQIKAKLGLSSSPSRRQQTGNNWNDSAVGNTNGSQLGKRHALQQAHQQDYQLQASTNSISTLDDELTDGRLDNELLSSLPTSSQLNDAKQLIGAALNSIPKTDFECTDKRGRFVSGLFADTKTGCRVWHLCANNRKYSFLCPTSTIFNSKARICDWRHNVKCE